MSYFHEPVSRASQNTNNELKFSAILNNKTCNKTPTRQIVMSVRANFADIYLRGMRDRGMKSGTE